MAFAPSNKPLRILVADRSEAFRRETVDLLHTIGVTADEAQTTEEVLISIGKSEPDVLLLGRLPGLGALNCLDIIQGTLRRAAPKIIFCASDAAFNTVWSALGHGATEYLLKPLTVDQLMSKLALIGALPAEKTGMAHVPGHRE